MVEKAFAWADSNKKIRVNQMHGEQEAFLVLSDSFAFTSSDIEESTQEGNIEVEDLGSWNSIINLPLKNIGK